MLIVATNIITINITIEIELKPLKYITVFFDDRFSVKHRSCMLIDVFSYRFDIVKVIYKTSNAPT
jgi:hypothetical protein